MDNNTIHTEKLISYIDGELTDAEIIALENELPTNEAMQQELENIMLAKNVVKNYGLTQQVASVHQRMMKEFTNKDTKPIAVVKSFPKQLMKLAAGIILLIGLFGLYQYINVSSTNLYADKFSAYNASTFRGAENASAIENAFAEKKYDQVITLNNQQVNSTIKENFLTAQSYLLKENTSKAIELFNKVLQQNKLANTSLLIDDSEYYLALAYLKNNEVAKAIPLFSKIHNNNNHLYHSKISSWYFAKLKLLNWKN